MRYHNSNTRHSGFTLIELMISMLIGLIIMGGVVSLYLSSSKNQQFQQGHARLQENARYAFERMALDLSQSGYLGCFRFAGDLTTNTLIAENGFGALYDFQTPLEAGNNNGFMGSDILTFRYARVDSKIPLIARSTPSTALQVDSSHPDYSQLDQYQLAIVSDCSKASIFMISNDPSTSGGIIEHQTGVTRPDGQGNATADLGNTYGSEPGNEVVGGSNAFLYSGSGVAHRYSLNTSQRGIASGGACIPATPEFCSLYRDDQEIAQGVQGFQIEAGWTDANNRVSFSAPVPGINWQEVDRLRLTLTMNTLDKIPDATGTAIQTKEYAKTIMLRNQI